MLYIHIGTHKTGTTSVQSFFDTNYAEEGGILYYPQIGKHEYGHHSIAWSVQNRGGDIQTFSHQLRVASEKSSHVLISSEEFSFLSASNVALLADFLKGVEVRVICYLRKRSDFLVSEYKQNVMMGAKRYKGSIMQFLFETRMLGRLSYANLLDRWSSAFGNENILPALYDHRTLLKGDIVLDVLDLLGLDVEGLDSSLRENVGLSDQAALLLSEMNQVDMPVLHHGFIVRALREMAGEKRILNQGEKDAIDNFYVYDDNSLVRKFRWREKDEQHLKSYWKAE